MALTNPLKIFQRIAKTGTQDQQFKQLCLDATDFSITLNGTARTLATEFGSVWGDINNLKNNVVWSGDTEQDIDGYKTFNNYLRIYDDGDEKDSAPRPNNASGFFDPDLYIYATGFTLHNSDNGHNYYYSLPNHSGTFAMASDIGLVLLDLRGYAI